MAREAEMDEQEAAFADKVRQLMQEQGKSQIELGEQMGVSQSAISNMLSRKCRPQRRTIDRAAEALGVPPTDLWPSYCSDDDSE
ncbi:helix-turn-helix protein [Posidoniimonas corsicana]|uniref:Helix-turn-helix protein n=2 Tax=Posidoniimonas corsicana TaxID=1938618 RepID=A0A5C5V074_9BACT|nr:helix-turn-helix protein [Posidoniimonas corsicana]